VDVGKSPFSVTWWFRFPSMLQCLCSNSYPCLLKNKTCSENYRNVFFLWWLMKYFTLNLLSEL